jgi:hypothetical protein
LLVFRPSNLLRWEGVGEVGLLGIAGDLRGPDAAPASGTGADGDGRPLRQPRENLRIDVGKLANIELADRIGVRGELRDVARLIESWLIEVTGPNGWEEGRQGEGRSAR